MISRTFAAAVALAAMLTPTVLTSPAVMAGESQRSGSPAPAEPVDQTSCVEIGGELDCYPSESALLAAHPNLAEPSGKSSPETQQSMSSNCSSSLRLYRNTSFGGGALYITTRAVVLNLSSFGFDNVTSSYKVGACSAVFWSGSSGSGSVYPGSTSASSWSTSMVSGWDNVVSSVYLY